MRAAADLVAGGAPLVDVREPDEFEEVRARGAKLIPLGEVPDRLAEIEPDVVIVVNRVYADEVRADLDGMGLTPEVEVA